MKNFICPFVFDRNTVIDQRLHEGKMQDREIFISDSHRSVECNVYSTRNQSLPLSLIAVTILRYFCVILESCLFGKFVFKVYVDKHVYALSIYENYISHIYL